MFLDCAPRDSVLHVRRAAIKLSGMDAGQARPRSIPGNVSRFDRGSHGFVHHLPRASTISGPVVRKGVQVIPPASANHRVIHSETSRSSLRLSRLGRPNWHPPRTSRAATNPKVKASCLTSN
jgi:hypothetical protein